MFTSKSNTIIVAELGKFKRSQWMPLVLIFFEPWDPRLRARPIHSMILLGILELLGIPPTIFLFCIFIHHFIIKSCKSNPATRSRTRSGMARRFSSPSPQSSTGADSSKTDHRKRLRISR
ncbi:GQ67_01919T0 [Komagataella phaffii]|nr:GQ67_01919T0 [Komagataella phaffii]AOA65622.1 GQ68_01934T0 [Komagataella phaffii GS115]